MPGREPSLKEMRERLKLQQALNRELERTARLEERIARAKSPARLSTASVGPRRKPTPPKKKPSAKRPMRAAQSTTRKRLVKRRRPSKSRTFEAQHPRGPGGRFLPTRPAQKAQPSPLRRWALFLRPAYGKKAYPNEVIVLILGSDPSQMSNEERGAWLRLIRKARHEEDSRVRWIVEQGSGPWLDPTVAPGTWWVERRENLP